MAKIDALRRFLLPCFSPPSGSSTTASTAAPTKKRLSTSLRDDIQENAFQETRNEDPASPTSSDELIDKATAIASDSIPPRPSKTMVVGTIFGRRRGHVWFCVQQDRLKTKPSLLLELSIPIERLVKEMKFGVVRIALECERSEMSTCHLHSVPIWTLSCNGSQVGFAVKRKASHDIRLMLNTMKSTSVGAGYIPTGNGVDVGEGELMYMRANYECVVGSRDSTSFHLINPDESSGQELSIFLLRSG